MVEVNLGAIRFNWRGAYAGGTAYVADDVVSSGGSSYICILASTGNAVSNATYWSQMSAAGTDGTDLTSTLTTQGDVLYRDGSGLQRLAKGTSAQVLTMGANDPAWADAAGGAWTLINSSTASNVASLTITGLDTSVYETFAIRVTNFIPVTDGRSFRIRLGDSGGIDTGSTDYGWVALSQQGGNHGPSVSGSNGMDHIKVDNYSGNASGENFSVTAMLSCAAASLKPHLHFTSSSVNANGNSMYHHGVGHRTAAINVTQVQVLFSSDNISSGRMTVWGIKHT